MPALPADAACVLPWRPCDFLPALQQGYALCLRGGLRAASGVRQPHLRCPVPSPRCERPSAYITNASNRCHLPCRTRIIS